MTNETTIEMEKIEQLVIAHCKLYTESDFASLSPHDTLMNNQRCHGINNYMLAGKITLYDLWIQTDDTDHINIGLSGELRREFECEIGLRYRFQDEKDIRDCVDPIKVRAVVDYMRTHNITINNLWFWAKMIEDNVETVSVTGKECHKYWVDEMVKLGRLTEEQAKLIS
jgi:hypothetical protein